MSSISSANKVIARTAAHAFGGVPRVARFWDDDHANSVDILTCKDRPSEGVNALSTVGLSEWPLFRGDEEFGSRAEIVGACGSGFRSFDNALATAAFCIINSKWFCCPGVVFPDVLAMYDCSPTMRHILFVPPFLWEGRLNTLDVGGRKVAWLLAVPISESERAFAEAEGSDRLEELFADRQIDIFDLHRRSEV